MSKRRFANASHACAKGSNGRSAAIGSITGNRTAGRAAKAFCGVAAGSPDGGKAASRNRAAAFFRRSRRIREMYFRRLLFVKHDSLFFQPGSNGSHALPIVEGNLNLRPQRPQLPSLGEWLFSAARRKVTPCTADPLIQVAPSLIVVHGWLHCFLALYL
jgi:hypothetical protein